MEIAGQTINLELPASPWRRRAILMASAESRTGQKAVQICAAAFMLSCPEAQRKDGAPTYPHDVLEYGEMVLDFLIPLGATMDEVIEVGNVAINMIVDAQVKESDLEAARGNSEGLAEN